MNLALCGVVWSARDVVSCPVALATLPSQALRSRASGGFGNRRNKVPLNDLRTVIPLTGISLRTIRNFSDVYRSF